MKKQLTMMLRRHRLRILFAILTTIRSIFIPFVAGAGNTYVSFDNNSIEKFTPAGAGAFFANPGFTIGGIAVDNAGNLFVANADDNTIWKYTPSGVASLFASSGLNDPTGLAFDNVGNLYAANAGDNTVMEFDSTGARLNSSNPGFSIGGVCPDSTGGLYAINYSNNTISKLGANGVWHIFFSGGFHMSGFAFDGTGNMYVGNSDNNTIIKVLPNGIASLFAVNIVLGGSAHLAFDSIGNLYAASSANNTAIKITPAGVTSIFANTFTSVPQYIAIKHDGPSDVLKGSVSFGVSTDPRFPFALIANFTPPNGMSLQDAASLLGVCGFNWIQMVTPPSYWHVRLIDSGLIMPTETSPVFPPFLDPAPFPGYTYAITSDLPDAHPQQWILPTDLSSDGKSFYYNEGAEVNSHIKNEGYTLEFKDAAVFPKSFLTAGDSIHFTTRLVGVRCDGSHTFFPYNTGFSWRSDAVFDDVAAIRGHVYGMYPLKETQETNVPPVLSGGVFQINDLTPILQFMALTNGTFTFKCTAGCGLVYQAQFSTNLTSTNWINVGNCITGTDDTISVSDGVTTEPNRFYRIQLLQ